MPARSTAGIPGRARSRSRWRRERRWATTTIRVPRPRREWPLCCPADELASAATVGAAFGLLLILQKSLARLERDGIDAALEGFGHGRVLLEAGTRIGLFAKLLEEHRRVREQQPNRDTGHARYPPSTP